MSLIWSLICPCIDRSVVYSEGHLPVLVVLYVPRQVHIEENEVMQVTAGEGIRHVYPFGLTCPFPHPEHGVLGNVLCGLHVL